ncbi:MAG: 2-hydroxychromene-2-carboxylate isomerase [Bermanella sp.]
MKTLDFYFDYLSPYAYFSWRKLESFCQTHNLRLNPQPVVFGKLLDHWGQLGPAEIPPKREWLAKYCNRYAHLHGFEMNPPKYHPFNSLTALRLSLPEVCGTDQGKVIGAIFEAGWTQGKDIGNPQVLSAILNEVGINGDALCQQIQETNIKEILKQKTTDAIERGVFGVPTMIIDDQLFWGNDQFEHLALYVSGNDPLEVDKVNASLKNERAIDRKVIGR